MERQAFFTAQGKPFYSIGIQSHNSSSYMPEQLRETFHAAQLLEVNTVAVPVPWERYEPEEGCFDDAFISRILSLAREYQLHLVLLWFGTWKNGTMEYTPEWVKQDTTRFPRVELKGGRKVLNLSPHCPANLEADRKAFVRMMQTLKKLDSEEQTVIAVQIQNEAGYLSGTRRDFSVWGEAAFGAEVPELLLDWCELHPECALAQHRKQPRGSWTAVFGGDGAEYLTAYAIAEYIEQMALAAKQIYPIFLYTNAWITIGRGIAGLDWPSGTCAPQNLDIYYAVCEHLDTLAPDIYIPELTGYLQMLQDYNRPDLSRALYIPESARTIYNSGVMFEAVGAGAIGFHVFGGESLLTDAQDALTEEGLSMYHSFHILRSVQPLLEQNLGVWDVHPIYRRGSEANMLICGLRGGWRAFISFTGTVDGFLRMDYRHKEACQAETAGTANEPSRGLLIQTDENTIYIAGQGFRVFLLPELAADGSLDALDASPALYPTNAEYASVREGHFSEDGTFLVSRCRTGDESRHGVFALWDSGAIEIRMSAIL